LNIELASNCQTTIDGCVSISISPF